MEDYTDYDYIIVGGGLTGCVLASRLAERFGASTSILLLEAGPDPKSNPNVTTPLDSLILGGSELDWAYKTAPNPATANREFTLTSGKTLGGGSVLNYGGWIRGDASDYDAWAQLVNDDRWSYNGLVPYMKRSERFSKEDADQIQQGTNGPMKITSVSASDPKRKYPLREPIRKAWKELGIEQVPAGIGKLAGLSEFLENWDKGIRQPAHLAYQNGLSGVDVRTDTPVHRVLFESLPGQVPRAKGVQLVNGRQIRARKEIVLSTGSFRTPQLLQLSGVGPADMLTRHSIPLIYDSPNVGANLFDHFALFQVFKLRGPERGLALGHPNLADPAFAKGFPVDWTINEALPGNLLQEALTEDGDKHNGQGLGLDKTGRTHYELMVMYHPMAPEIPVDGSHIGTSVMLTLPTSRGTIGLASSSPNDAPLIETNYFTTALDRAALVQGVRRLLEGLTNTEAGRDIIEIEVPPSPELKALSMDSSLEEIEDRIRKCGFPHFHPAGTCALGKVLDAELRVKGVQGLRVVDASVFPSPVGGHPQATLYGIAEQAAEMIIAQQ